MNEHERLLAEGPRVAPEPDAVSSMGTAVEPAKPRAETTRRRTGLSWPRLIPVVAFVGFVIAQGTGLGRYAFGIFIAVAVISMFFRSKMLSR